jgi:thiol-disulfide isomerase/thioredoxin
VGEGVKQNPHWPIGAAYGNNHQMMKWTELCAKASLAVAIGLSLSISMISAQSERLQPARVGTTFPDLADVQAIRPDGAAKGNLQPYDLKQAMSGKVVVFFYWLAGDETSEEVLKEVAVWAEGKDNLALVGVVPPRGKTAGEVAERLAALNLDIPCIWDSGYRVQQTLRASSVPYMSVVDQGNVVRLLGAYNLRHKVLVNISLETYLETALGGGGAPSIVSLPRHYPVTELIDEPYKDFSLIPVPAGEVVRLSDHVKEGQYALLIFWSPDCGHCKKELPILNDYYKKNSEHLSLIGIVKATDQGIRQRTADFIRIHQLDWPTVDDKSFLVFKDYLVRSTPTTIVVNPSGIIESVLLGSSIDLDKELGPLIEKLKETTVAADTVTSSK